MRGTANEPNQALTPSRADLHELGGSLSLRPPAKAKHEDVLVPAELGAAWRTADGLVPAASLKCIEGQPEELLGLG